ncbi:hypothetical protein [Flagellimonas eckloniae]|uniref:Uncharacterized protein n=1 Tax=Flagellimonas eckloniae TaxID=346185 RepID=A0A0N8WG14_9FLAO|nr:hypothetical protein [Allomuricauda eckloniae]KQC30227.1 hypothetical protein AAY42_10335 [Allomuricauda eckloniae]
MKNSILAVFTLLILTPCLGQENSDESKPNAAIGVVEALTNTFLPGVFSGVKGLLEQFGNRADREEMEDLNAKVTELEDQSIEQKQEAKEIFEDLNKYYESEVLDFESLNLVFLKVSIFSTKVGTLTMASDLLTDDNVAFTDGEAEIAVINLIKDASNSVVSNFDVDETMLKSRNPLLNTIITGHIRTIKAVILRMENSGLTATSTTNMTSDDIDNYFEMVRNLKNNGNRRFADMENSVTAIQEALATYLQSFQTKTEKINTKVTETLKKL